MKGMAKLSAVAKAGNYLKKNQQIKAKKSM
jgi:hypothetical protein